MANIDLSQYGIKKRQIQVLKALKKDRKANWELLM